MRRPAADALSESIAAAVASSLAQQQLPPQPPPVSRLTAIIAAANGREEPTSSGGGGGAASLAAPPQEASWDRSPAAAAAAGDEALLGASPTEGYLGDTEPSRRQLHSTSTPIDVLGAQRVGLEGWGPQGGAESMALGSSPTAAALGQDGMQLSMCRSKLSGDMRSATPPTHTLPLATT